jgi:hypothetical protein
MAYGGPHPAAVDLDGWTGAAWWFEVSALESRYAACHRGPAAAEAA